MLCYVMLCTVTARFKKKIQLTFTVAATLWLVETRRGLNYILTIQTFK
jgi:hypothetical protein